MVEEDDCCLLCDVKDYYSSDFDVLEFDYY